MKYFLIILISFFSISFYGQENTISNKSNEVELYTVMQIVINHLHLKKEYQLAITPDTGKFYKIDNRFLSSFLIDSTSIKLKLKFDSINNNLPLDSMPLMYPYSTSEADRCLTQKDISSLLENKKISNAFKWQPSKLGFNKQNKKEWYKFSLPIFNYDHSKAIIIVSYECKGFLCGDGDIVLFKKEGNKWSCITLQHWVI